MNTKIDRNKVVSRGYYWRGKIDTESGDLQYAWGVHWERVAYPGSPRETDENESRYSNPEG